MTALVELRAAMASLGLTPSQQDELETDPDRAAGWIEWAAGQRLTKPAAVVLTRFRQGMEAPDPNAWRGDQAEKVSKSGPDYAALLRACEALVEHCGHVMSEADLAGETYVPVPPPEGARDAMRAAGFSFPTGSLHVPGEVRSDGEFDRLGRDPRAGNGAVLTDADRDRLLRNAAVRRSAWESRSGQRAAVERALALRMHARAVLTGLAEKHLRGVGVADLDGLLGPGFVDDVMELVARVRAARGAAAETGAEPAFVGEEP